MTRVIVSFWGRRGGGLRMARNLADSLDATVALSLRDSRDGAGARVLPALGSPLAAPLTFSALHSAARDFAPDAHVCAMNAAWAWPLAPRLPGRFIYVAHDGAPHPGDYAPLWQTSTQARLLARADTVVAPSLFTAELLGEIYPAIARKIIAAPLACMTPSQTEAPRPAPVLPLRVLVAGRLLAYKGLGKLAAIVAALPRDGWTLTVAGHGSAELAALDGDPRITVLRGWLPDAAFDALFPSHDVLLCPYDEASQSGVVAQALACAVPCVVSPVGALPEQIGWGQAGVVSTDGRPEALAEALRVLIAAPSQVTALSEGCLALMRAAHASNPWNAIVDRAP